MVLKNVCEAAIRHWVGIKFDCRIGNLILFIAGRGIAESMCMWTVADYLIPEQWIALNKHGFPS